MILNDVGRLSIAAKAPEQGEKEKVVTPIESGRREIVKPLFENCPYDRVLTDSVLEGHFGNAYVDVVDDPQVARLDSGAFTMLGGYPRAELLSICR